MTDVEKREQFLRRQRLQWFGHIKRMDDERAPLKAKTIAVYDSKRGRPKKRWKEAIEKEHTG